MEFTQWPEGPFPERNIGQAGTCKEFPSPASNVLNN